MSNKSKKIAFFLTTALISFPVLANAENAIRETVTVGIDGDESLSDVTINSGRFVSGDDDSGFGVIVNGGSRFTGHNVTINGENIGIGVPESGFHDGSRRSEINISGDSRISGGNTAISMDGGTRGVDITIEGGAIIEGTALINLSPAGIRLSEGALTFHPSEDGARTQIIARAMGVGLRLGDNAVVSGSGLTIEAERGIYSRGHKDIYFNLSDVTINASLAGMEISQGWMSGKTYAELDNFTINVEGDYTATGVDVGRGGQVKLTNGTITVSAEAALASVGSIITDASGIASVGSFEDRVDAENVHVITQGDNVYGLFAGAEYVGSIGLINFTGGSIITHGVASYGVYATRGQAMLDGTQLVTKGDSAHGVGINNVGRLILRNSAISAEGTGSSGIAISSGEAEVENSIISAADYGVRVFGDGRIITLSFKGRSVISGDNGALNVIQGLATFTLDNSYLNGRSIVNDRSIGILSLSDKSVWTIDGNSNITNLVNDGSEIRFAENVHDDGQDFSLLTVNGFYIGNNGLFVLHAALNTGTSDSPRDHVLIEGKADGQTRVAVNNRGGFGGLTDENGINLITVNGGLGDYGADTFVMDGDYLHNGEVVIAGGAYIYTLEHKENADGSDEWNLHSVFEESKDENGGGNEGGGNGGGEDGNGDRQAVYGAGVPLYEAYPQVLQRMNSLPTMQQRVGERRFVDGGADGLDNRGFWMRVEGSTGHFNAAHSTSRASFDLDAVKTQFGLDFDMLETDSGRLVGGLYVQYGHGRADVLSRYGRGDIKVDAYGFGSTLTWQGNNGFYVDGQAQVQWFDSSLYSRSRNGANGFDKHLTTGNDGMGYALSLEGGRAFALANGWQVTPQVQLSYSHVDFDSFHDLVNAHVESADGDSLTGRLGLSVERTRNWQAAAGDNRALKFYGIGNIYQEFLDGTSVKVGGVDFRHRAERTWAGIGAGVDYSWKEGAFALYGEVNAATSFKDFGDSYNLQGTIGFKAKF